MPKNKQQKTKMKKEMMMMKKMEKRKRKRKVLKNQLKNQKSLNQKRKASQNHPIKKANTMTTSNQFLRNQNSKKAKAMKLDQIVV